MHDESLPTRIESAFRALAYTHAVESGGMTITPRGPQATQPRLLTSAETALRNSAAEVIRNFITGEIRVPRVPRARRSQGPRSDSTTGQIENLQGLDLDFGDEPGRERPAA
jgi:hypothetical protein